MNTFQRDSGQNAKQLISKMRFNQSYAKWRPFSLGFNVYIHLPETKYPHRLIWNIIKFQGKRSNKNEKNPGIITYVLLKAHNVPHLKSLAKKYTLNAEKR